MVHLTIFASGNGTNAEKLMEYFEFDDEITINAVFTNNIDAFVIERAKNYGVAYEVFDKNQFAEEKFNRLLDQYLTDYIVLAGFLWKVPEHLIKSYPNKIINIHPSLLPKFGGKGMYGENVHKAVLLSGENESGITIHLVNEEYDQGRILHQVKCDVSSSDTVMSLAEKIHKLEHEHLPRVVKEYITSSS